MPFGPRWHGYTTRPVDRWLGRAAETPAGPVVKYRASHHHSTPLVRAHSTEQPSRARAAPSFCSIPHHGLGQVVLRDCFDDISGCCLTLFCPCITFGRIAAIVDQGATSCCVSGTLYCLLSAWTGGQPSIITGGLGCLYSCCYRARLRTQYAIPEGPCNCPDCCVHLWCEPCALCQEYRELKAQGFDMSAGWEGNMERTGKAGAAIAPPQMHPGMSR